MEATVIWNHLLELASTEKLWSAEAYIVNLAARHQESEEDAEDPLAEEVAEALDDPDSTIYHLKGQSSSVGTFFAQALKDKIASARLRDLRAYDYLGDGKSSVMYFDIEEHNELFRNVISRLDRKDYEETSDIFDAKKGSFFLVSHDFDLAGQKMRCIAGRKTFPRRLAHRVKDEGDHFPTVGVYFEDGVIKCAQKSYFEFDEDIDFLIVDTKIFIFNKYYFEQSTRFVSKMFEQTDEVFDEIASALFVDHENMMVDLLTENPKKLRRKVATIKKNDLTFYEDQEFIARFAQASNEEEWGYAFERVESGELKMRFPYTDENKIDALFTILNDGRLHSKLTGRTYDATTKREVRRPQ